MYYAVKFSGIFGYIKPWTATRDTLTKSSFYISKSTMMGIERKLFPELIEGKNETLEKIIRHRLSFSNISFQQEATKSIAYPIMGNKNNRKVFPQKNFIVNRGVLIKPILILLFNNFEDANIAIQQHICLTRNEDILFGKEIIEINSIDDFNNENKYSGYEMLYNVNEEDENIIFYGINRYTNKNQFGKHLIVGEPINIIE